MYKVELDHISLVKCSISNKRLIPEPQKVYIYMIYIISLLWLHKPLGLNDLSSTLFHCICQVHICEKNSLRNPHLNWLESCHAHIITRTLFSMRLISGQLFFTNSHVIRPRLLNFTDLVNF